MFWLRESLLVLVVAAAPVIELRGSIPLGVGVLGLPVWWAVFVSLLGNSLLFVLVYALGERWIRFTDRRKSGGLKRLTDHVLYRSRKVFGNGRHERYGLLALALFVAVPLPMTGVLTGSVAAFLFGLSWRRSWPYVLLGMCVAATIVTLITTGTLSFLDFLLKDPMV